jgi:hypothetical protein
MHPLGHWPQLADTVTAVLFRYVTPLNAIVLGTQLLSVVAIFRRRWTIALTGFYDIQHIGIFLTTGIFFWKWIVLNSALLVGLGLIRRPFSPAAVIVALVMLLVGPYVFFIARLGWFDTMSVNDVYAVAETTEGRRVALPSNRFLYASIWAAQMDAASLLPNGFPTGTWGATADPAIAEAGRRCALAPKPPGDDAAAREERLARFTRLHHAALLRLADGEGRINQDLFPHHIWSTPLLAPEASALDERTVVAYVWRLERLCFGRTAAGRELVSRELGYELRVPVVDVRRAENGASYDRTQR